MTDIETTIKELLGVLDDLQALKLKKIEASQAARDADDMDTAFDLAGLAGGITISQRLIRDHIDALQAGATPQELEPTLHPAYLDYLG
jgi:hypothetical protein